MSSAERLSPKGSGSREVEAAGARVQSKLRRRSRQSMRFESSLAMVISHIPEAFLYDILTSKSKHARPASTWRPRARAIFHPRSVS